MHKIIQNIIDKIYIFLSQEGLSYDEICRFAGGGDGGDGGDGGGAIEGPLGPDDTMDPSQEELSDANKSGEGSDTNGYGRTNSEQIAHDKYEINVVNLLGPGVTKEDAQRFGLSGDIVSGLGGSAGLSDEAIDARSTPVDVGSTYTDDYLIDIGAELESDVSNPTDDYSGGAYAVNADGYTTVVSSNGSYTVSNSEGLVATYDAESGSSFTVSQGDTFGLGEFTQYTGAIDGIDISSSREYTTGIASMFGDGLYDQSYNIEGEELGIIDESIADILENGLGIQMTPAIASAIQSTTTVAMSLIGGLPSGVLGRIGLISNIARMTSDIAYSQGLISKSDRDIVRGISAVIGISTTVITTVQTIDIITTLKSYGIINSVTAIIGVTLELYQLGVQINELTKVLEKLGIISTPTIGDVYEFQSSEEGENANNLYNNDNNIRKVYQRFAQWYFDKTNKGNHITADSVSKNPFDFMAGGYKYDIQNAGSQLYHPSDVPNSTTCIDFNNKISKHARQSLFQEDSTYVNLEPIRTTMSQSSSSKIGIARRAHFEALMEERNALVETSTQLIDIYEGKVENYNSEVQALKDTIDKFNLDIESASAKDSSTFDSRRDSIEASKTELTEEQSILISAKASLEATIEQLQININEIDNDILDLI